MKKEPKRAKREKKEGRVQVACASNFFLIKAAICVGAISDVKHATDWVALSRALDPKRKHAREERRRIKKGGRGELLCSTSL